MIDRIGGFDSTLFTFTKTPKRTHVEVAPWHATRLFITNGVSLHPPSASKNADNSRVGPDDLNLWWGNAAGTQLCWTPFTIPLDKARTVNNNGSSSHQAKTSPHLKAAWDHKPARPSSKSRHLVSCPCCCCRKHR